MAAMLSDAQRAKWGEVASAILDGAHDDELSKIEQAVAHRKKARLTESGIRKGARVRIKVSPRAAEYSGKEGVVEKINKVRVSVDVKCDKCGSAKHVSDNTPWGDRCDKCHGHPQSVGIPHDLLEVI